MTDSRQTDAFTTTYRWQKSPPNGTEYGWAGPEPSIKIDGSGLANF